MNIIIIANNTEGNIDGIGKHARLLKEEFLRQGYGVELISGFCNTREVVRIFSLAMSIAYIKTIVQLFKKKYDLVVVEYPFCEHNPIVILFHFLLYLCTRLCKAKVGFSMHEYDRLNVLRRRLIDLFGCFSDIIYVSEIKYISRFDKGRNKYHLRTIPNHVTCNKTNKPFNINEFCYFGLISKAKAFKEMIDAWTLFNKDKRRVLHVVSSSELPKDLIIPDSVVYHHDLPHDEVVDILFNSAFSIVPVLPAIGLNNSSFVSSIQCGCIPIGKFEEEIGALDFIIPCEDYSLDKFVEAMNRTQSIDKDKFRILSDKCINYGKSFSLSSTAKQMIEGYIKYLNYANKK